MEKIQVEVDLDLAELIPGYLANRREDLLAIDSCLKADDFETIRRLAHRMKGSGGGYGFHGISAIGGLMEAGATAADPLVIKTQLAALTDYLERVAVNYV